MIETPGISEIPEAPRAGLPPDFYETLKKVKAMAQLPVHKNLNYWMRINHSFGPDAGGGD